MPESAAIIRRFDEPDERREFPLGRFELVTDPDTCRWVPRSELTSLPLVELAEHGARLAYGTA